MSDDVELKVGDTAPDFSSAADSGKTVSLKDFLGKKNVVLYFYPKDETPGCTKEACGFRDNIEKLKSLDAEVLGVSYDSVESHVAFKKKYNLPFTLLSDKDKNISKTYGAVGIFKAKRMTFIINRERKITHIFPQVDPTHHSIEIIEALEGLK